MFQKTNCGFSQSAQAVVLMAKWVPAHEHSTLLYQLTVICSSLVGDLAVEGMQMLNNSYVVYYYCCANAFNWVSSFSG